MDEMTIIWLVVGFLFITPFLWNIHSFFVRISGRWYEFKADKGEFQEIQLHQIGPIVWGSSKVKGGILRYSGWFDGKRLTLKRRDFGRQYLAELGFPNELLLQLDGSEMARMTFYFDAKKREELKGEHFPQKIEISRTRPPKIVERVYLPPKSKIWTRTKITP